LIRNRYVRAGNLLWWSIYVSWFSGGNVLSGSPSASIYINIPGLYNGATSQIKSVDYVAGIAGVSITGGLTVTTLGSTYVAIEKADRSNFALTDIPGFLFGMWLEVG
jgi:hypothetical protein